MRITKLDTPGEESRCQNSLVGACLKLFMFSLKILTSVQTTLVLKPTSAPMVDVKTQMGTTYVFVTLDTEIRPTERNV